MSRERHIGIFPTPADLPTGEKALRQPKKPDQAVQSVGRAQLAELLSERSEENVLVIPVGAKFSDVANRINFLY
jgi:hypothetical protein